MQNRENLGSELAHLGRLEKMGRTLAVRLVFHGDGGGLGSENETLIDREMGI